MVLNLSKIFLFSYVFCFCLSANASLKEFKVEKYKLSNGMTVLLHQDSSLPIYSLHIWYDVGSSDENPSRTGLAHFFEHLMFKGTKKNPEGVYDDTIEENGGSNNAFTTRDYTGYHVDMPAGTLKKVLELEADRMVNLKLTKDMIKREREVVKEERRMRVDNSPSGLAFESVFLNAYKNSSYRWPVIGSMKHLENSTIKDFQSFYDQYYAPNNAVLVLVGDFKKSRAKKWIKNYFGKLESKKITRNAISGDKVFAKGGRVIKIKKPVQSKSLTMSFPGVSVFNKDTYALDLLSSILTSGTSSRMYKKLIDEKKYGLDVGAWNYTPTGEGLFLFFNTLRPGQSVRKYKNEFTAVLKNLVKSGVTLKELKAAKKYLKVSSLRSYKTLSGKARGLAVNEILFKDYRRLFTDLKKYQAVTVEDVNKVARKYLDFNKMNSIEVGK